MVALREYQVRSVDKLRESHRSGNRSMILCLPTGAGKTVCIAEVIRNADAKGKNVLFLTHRQEIVRQCSEKLSLFGVHHGIIQAGELQTPSRVQVASKDTLYARAIRSKKMQLPEADLVIPDEAHRSLSKVWLRLLNHYLERGATVIGLTATPARGDGRGLGEFYQDIVYGSTYAELIGGGFLVPTRVFAPYKPNLKGVKLTNGDYNQQQLGTRMDKPGLVGNIYDTWASAGWDRPTILFASSVAHSLHCRDVFLGHGIRAAHLDGKTPDNERREITRRFTNGDIQVITNCGVFVEGIDLPAASCCILARPTRSIVLYRQMVGRVVRPAPGKVDAIVLDHAGAVFAHGLPDIDIPWDISATSNVKEAIDRQKKEGKLKETIVCPSCKCAFSGTSVCPSCGDALPGRKGKEKDSKEGILTEIGRDGKYADPEDAQRKKDWNRALGQAANRNGTFKMAQVLYKSATGKWPPDSLLPADKSVHGQKVKDVFPGYVRKKKVSA